MSDIKLPIQKFQDTGQDSLVTQSLAVQGHLNGLVESQDAIAKTQAQAAGKLAELAKRINLLNNSIDVLEDDYSIFGKVTDTNINRLSGRIRAIENKKNWFQKLFSWVKF